MSSAPAANARAKARKETARRTPSLRWSPPGWTRCQKIGCAASARPRHYVLTETRSATAGCTAEAACISTSARARRSSSSTMAGGGDAGTQTATERKGDNQPQHRERPRNLSCRRSLTEHQIIHSCEGVWRSSTRHDHQRGERRAAIIKPAKEVGG